MRQQQEKREGVKEGRSAGAGGRTKLRDGRHIGDFRGWKEHDAYRKALDRLLRDLRVETT